MMLQKGGEKLSNKKQTSPRVAKTASKVLRDDRYSKAAKTVAGSALAQAGSKSKSTIKTK